MKLLSRLLSRVAPGAWYHTVDYLKEDGRRRGGAFLHRAIFFHEVPRWAVFCRLFGHRPVVDGVGVPREDGTGHVARWIMCPQCGIRPDPQGSLDPSLWGPDDYYTGPRGGPVPDHPAKAAQHFTDLKRERFYLPGPWPARLRTDASVEVVMGSSLGWGFEFKVGEGGSDNKTALHLHAGKLGSVFLSFGNYGARLYTALNRHGKESRLIGFRIGEWTLRWNLWSLKNGWSSDKTPKWRDGYVNINPLDLLLGTKRYEYVKTGGYSAAFVRMPDSDHPVELVLKQQIYGRRRGSKRRTWSVTWTCKTGIPTSPDRADQGRISGLSVKVSDESVLAGTWPDEAVCLIALDLMHRRTRNNWDASGTALPATAAQWRAERPQS